MGVTVVDAGVVIAVLDRNDAHHQSAARALDAARARGDQLVLPASAYSEVLVRPSRAGHDAIGIVDAVVDGLPLSIEPINRRIAAAAAAIRASYGRSLRLPDALVLATAQALHAERLLTTDARLPVVGAPIELIGGS